MTLSLYSCQYPQNGSDKPCNLHSSQSQCPSLCIPSSPSCPQWSTRRGRIRDDSSTPARYPETPSVTSLRWKWKAAYLFSICFSCFLAFAQSVSSLFTKHLNNWNKSLQLYVQANQTLFSLLQWADLHFPSCHHGKRCLMRTVLKLGPNNGRNFYTCSFQKGKQCDFFQWAENGPGVSILPGC